MGGVHSCLPLTRFVVAIHLALPLTNATKIYDNLQGKTRMIELLLKCGANPLLFNQNGYGAHSIAYFAEHFAQSRMIANAGVVYAIVAESFPQMLLMIQDGADVNIQNTQGWTALIAAASHGQSSIVQNLLEQYRGQINVNLPENDGWTALHFAANNNHKNVARMLLDHGADVSHRSSGLAGKMSLDSCVL